VVLAIKDVYMQFSQPLSVSCRYGDDIECSDIELLAYNWLMQYQYACICAVQSYLSLYSWQCDYLTVWHLWHRKFVSDCMRLRRLVQ